MTDILERLLSTLAACKEIGDQIILPLADLRDAVAEIERLRRLCDAAIENGHRAIGLSQELLNRAEAPKPERWDVLGKYPEQSGETFRATAPPGWEPFETVLTVSGHPIVWFRRRVPG